MTPQDDPRAILGPYTAVQPGDVTADRRFGCYTACMGGTGCMFAEITPKSCFQGAPLYWSEDDLYVEILCLATISNCLCQITMFRKPAWAPG